jgi:predicted nucleotidyltransferase component of viral defense system
MNSESIKAKLKNIANEESGKSFLELFKQLTFERFLIRVSTSAYRKNLIFKGGLCLKQYIDTGRETKDIDFLVKQIDGKKDTINRIFEEIAAIDLEDSFEFYSVSTSILDLEHKQYPGFRVKIELKLGNMTDRLQIDIGIGDVVDEYEIGLHQLEYKNAPLIGKTGVSLYAYPPEFIFSEKLQAIIELKNFNSRMKDYFDCYKLIESGLLDKEKVKNAVEKTFQKRNTDIQKVENFSEELEPTWDAFSKKIKFQGIGLKEVISKINDFLNETNIVS